MRAYLPITAKELESFLSNGDFAPAEIFAVTEVFIAENPGLDLEECEYLRSLEAAALALQSGDVGFVLAVEISEGATPKKSDIECLFQVRSGEADEIELTWFGPTEISHHLSQWLAQ